MLYADVGDSIREARKRAGLNQEELAELARLNRVTIAKYEAGKVEPGAQALSRIADALDVTVDELLGRSAPDEAPKTIIIDNQPKTEEARLLVSGVDRMPEADRKKAVDIMKMVFEQYKPYFERKDSDDT